MIRLPYRSTWVRRSLVCCSLLVVISGCGQDEAVFPVAVEPGGDEDGGQTTTPTTVTPTPPQPTTVTPTPPSSGTTTKLAAACSSDVDCGSGLKCLTAAGSDWLGGGAPNGFCTADCTDGGDAMCDGLTSGSLCMQTTGGNYCVAQCTAGSDSNPKCQGRPDVACDVITLSDAGLAFCRPMCRSDADCGGRKCLLGNGACVDALPGADPLGLTCDPEAAQNACVSGFCAGGITEGTALDGYCSGLCTFGAGGCGSTELAPAKAGDASCFPAYRGGGVGDIGLCLQTCDCDDDCDAEGFLCAQVEGALEQLGVTGFCFEYDLEIPETSTVILGVACGDAEVPDAMSSTSSGGGSDAMSPVDASGPGDGSVLSDATSSSSADGSATSASSAPGDAAADAR